MDSTTIVFQIAILIMSVVIHEVSHGFVAYLMGDSTAKYAGRLTLNPIPHLSFFGMVILPVLTFFAWGVPVGSAQPVPYNPYNLRYQKWGPGIVAAAGPLSNILVAFVFGVLYRVVSASTLPFWGSFSEILSAIVFINVLLAVFNLIPIPPIDGSKVVFPFLPIFFQQRLMFWWQQYRPFLVRNWFVFLILFILFGPAVLSVIFRVIGPIISFLFTLFTGAASPIL